MSESPAALRRSPRVPRRPGRWSAAPTDPGECQRAEPDPREERRESPGTRLHPSRGWLRARACDRRRSLPAWPSDPGGRTPRSRGSARTSESPVCARAPPGAMLREGPHRRRAGRAVSRTPRRSGPGPPPGPGCHADRKGRGRGPALTRGSAPVIARRTGSPWPWRAGAHRCTARRRLDGRRRLPWPARTPEPCPPRP